MIGHFVKVTANQYSVLILLADCHFQPLSYLLAVLSVPSSDKHLPSLFCLSTVALLFLQTLITFVSVYPSISLLFTLNKDVYQLQESLTDLCPHFK